MGMLGVTLGGIGKGLGEGGENFVKALALMQEDQRRKQQLAQQELFQQAQMGEMTSQQAFRAQQQAALEEELRNKINQREALSKLYQPAGPVSDISMDVSGEAATPTTVMQPGKKPTMDELMAVLMQHSPEKAMTLKVQEELAGERIKASHELLAQKLEQALKLFELTGDVKFKMMGQQLANELDKIEARGVQARQTQAEKPPTQRTPPGYRETSGGDLEPIPGGPADFKKQNLYAQDTASLDSTVSELGRLAKVANEIKTHPGLKGITGMRGALPNLPGGDAANAEAMLNTLKSQTAFSVLQNMRNNSKTGGALGQVSDKEGELLQNNLAALGKAQSYDAYQKSLQTIIDYADSASMRMRKAYETKWGEKQPTTQATPQATPKSKFTIRQVR